MANLSKKSIQDLLELDYGISTLIQVFTANNNYDPSCFGKKAWQGIYQVLITQQEAQKEIHSRILEKIGQIEFESSIIEDTE